VFEREVAAIVAELRAQWAQRFRLTTIPQAMERLGIADDWELRWAVATALQEHLEGRDAHQRWGMVPIVLREEEKLLARYLLRTVEPGRRRRLSLAEAASAIGTSPEAVRRGLRLLARLGLCHWEEDARATGGRVTWYRRALQRAGGLGFNFHTVTLATGERFGVP
jgi:predicted transcriptional regulator